MRILSILAATLLWEGEAPAEPATAQGYAGVAPSQESLRRACEFLWSQQAEDGGWHSQQYAMLRSGQALTPFVLHALLGVPESTCPRPDGGVERALGFLRQHVDESGALGRADPEIAEYPVYSTAYALQCFAAIKSDAALSDPGDLVLRSKLVGFLATAQFDESEGFTTIDPAYGGWGFDVAKAKGMAGHMDLAHTRRALEALRSVITEKSSPVFTRAELFLRVVQREPGRLSGPARVTSILLNRREIDFDGGFYFSPVVEDANKGRFAATHGGASVPHFRSYATATCDGVLALLAASVPRDDRRVVKAAEWLAAHQDFEYPQGVPTDHPEPWGDAIRFYHYAVRAEAYDALDWPGDWRQRLSETVAVSQAADGSFRNTLSPLMKEDDPILCTALATVALRHCAK